MTRVEKVWFGAPRKLIKFGKLTVRGSKCRVRINGDMLEAFKVETGVRQCYRTTPLLLDIALEDTL